ncbi:MAG TPA: hypothetical protein VMU50_04575 [Polyangia bacterium]|nr:hypothetical protein [Polyangia bacterium]
MTGPSLDRLYSASRGSFVDVRQQLVKELKAAGRKDEAAEVAKAQKPTAAAWALNQLARRHGDLLGRLGRAGATLRKVQLHGGGGGAAARDKQAFADAVTAQRAALAEARVAVEALLREEGSGAPPHLLESILRALRGGAASDEAQAALEAGRFAREPDAQDLSLLAGGAVFGIGDAAAPPVKAAPPARAKAAEAGGGKSAAEDVRAEKAAAAEAAARARAHAHAAAERAAKNLSAALDKAVALQKQRERDVAEARGALAAAEALFSAARSAAETARVALAEAERHRRETS